MTAAREPEPLRPGVTLRAAGLTGIAIALGVLALFFIPVIVVLGSILITGRTM